MSSSRREFIQALGSLGGMAFLPLLRTEPDLILYNGNIWTVDARQPRAQAVAISGGRFLAVGSNDEVLGLATGGAKKIDLGGNTVLPGSRERPDDHQLLVPQGNSNGIASH